jgi:hypothetical protein
MATMSTPVAKKGRTVLTSSDPCPRGCRTGANGPVHLMSDHVDETMRQCTKCACVVQDTHEVKPG